MDLIQLRKAITSRIKRAAAAIVRWYKRASNKLLRYFVPNETDDDSTHVTTSNLEKHRKQILEQARRHVKPQAATNSHVVRNSLIVGVFSLIFVAAGLYVSVFQLQPTNNFYYRLSQILPIPVGEIADQNITYDRVLFYFRAESRAEDFELSEPGSVDNKQERLQRSFLSAREAVYIESLAEAQDVSVSDEEVQAIISDLPLLESGSTDLDVVLQEFRGWTRADLFRETRLEALKSSKLVPNRLAELTEATSFEQFQQLTTDLNQEAVTTGKLSDIEDSPSELTGARQQLADGNASPLVATNDGTYILFKRPNVVRYTLVPTEIRKQLIEAQAADVASRSCLSDVSFTDAGVMVEAGAGYTSCLF